jgi:hypothetical protein
MICPRLFIDVRWWLVSLVRVVRGVLCSAGRGTACNGNGWFGREWNKGKELGGPAGYDSDVWDWWLYFGSVEGSDPLK